jgi:hypothetical protein
MKCVRLTNQPNLKTLKGFNNNSRGTRHVEKERRIFNNPERVQLLIWLCSGVQLYYSPQKLLFLQHPPVLICILLPKPKHVIINPGPKYLK